LNAGRVRGPRALASAEIIMDPNWDEARLRSYVREALPYRPDYFKTYAALRPESVAVVVEEARKQGIPVIGHMGRTSWGEAAGIGVAHLTHAVDWSPLSLRPERRSAYAAALSARGGIRARVDWLELLDPSAAEVAAMLDRVKAAGISVDPTLVAYDSKFSDPSSGRYRRNPHVNVIPELHRDWRSCATITADWTPDDYRRWARAWPNMLALVGEMHRRGILLTTGTDITNPWVIPGESLHQEFELLVEAGIKPADVLKMTGENAARALGLDDVGVVEAGRRADLVLLSADPRTDIRNTRSIRWVMQGGKLVSKEPGPPR
jgi:imidazolonepropionase-like amidohydrolase